MSWAVAGRTERKNECETLEMISAPPYQPLEGCDTPALQPCVERWEMMQPWLPQKLGRVVDLGCHTGWFCREFAAAGWRVYGIDRSEDWIKIARSQDRYLDPNAPWYVTGDIFELPLPPSPDVILCLSLAMYLFENLERGWALFHRISEAAPMMFMDFGGQYADRMPFNEATVVEQMLENTTYTSAQLLGHTDFEARPLFLFSR